MMDYAPHPSSVQGNDFRPQLWVRPGLGHHGQGPKLFTASHHQWGGKVVPPTGRDSCHRHRATGRVHPLAPLRLYS
jgi:hypothetical protein